MRTRERLTKLKEWTEKKMCEGRRMKAPGKNGNLAEIDYREPQCYLAWAPARKEQHAFVQTDSSNVCPCIIIMPDQSYARYTEEKRFDRYNNVNRSRDMGQHLSVSVLFCVYEPGVRLPGFADSVGENGRGLDMSLILEGTEQGLFALTDWMDDFTYALLGQKMIPGTDLVLEENTMIRSLYTDQSYVVDRRPLYYGFVNVSFACYAAEEKNKAIEDLLN